MRLSGEWCTGLIIATKVEVPAELADPQIAQTVRTEEILLHKVQEVFWVWVIRVILLPLLWQLHASMGRNNELRKQVLRWNSRAHHTKAHQAIIAHAQPDIA